MDNGCSILEVQVEYASFNVEVVSVNSELQLQCDDQATFYPELNPILTLLTASMEESSSLSCTAEEGAILTVPFVCTLSDTPYLEITPTTLWILPELYTDNEVLSNTLWKIN